MDIRVRLIKSAFYKEKETREGLAAFVRDASLFSMDRECRKFEEDFAKKQGRRFAVFVTSGSAANLVLIQALLNLDRLRRGDKVGFSSLTWSTNVMPLIQLGLVPVPLDSNLSTLNVSPRDLEEKIGDLQGLFLTNTLGFCDDIGKIKSMCEAKGVVFLEDNCESLGSKAGGRLLGNFGEASTFSFFVGHHMSTIEGGMICTDDDELHNMLLMTRIHGWDRNLPGTEQDRLRRENGVDDFYAKYTFYDLAFNARPTEINGFLGNAQLGYLDEIVFRREGNYKLFNYVARKNDDFFPLDFSHMELVSNFAYPVICKSRTLAEKYRKKCQENGVETRPIIAGDISKQPFYRKYAGGTRVSGNAELVHENGFYFGNNPELTEDELRILCGILEK
ncbi:MAG: DegT/DnrJ/EryC1/StrS aminotransferase family protein [Candidatus Moranbacteria bacterium]|nr:DegT/DnrJ/EryC1/StrS aminotransferase family protein [Candidatus Moranbacteria bacterium]